ncbi:Antibiotic biosynthesis monooxygenase [Macrophomina phaseolina MS6]|uniref:Antibiotic biosynthesis monooxygenase n=1 Tax=Macrophomina phaseolina (strain MS6) TaxID=1126212 RepID=K2S5R4_MACPH|nr:Antibiotic biosynthesis monooxygenase [Macrophomina phaseolina MS6]
MPYPAPATAGGFTLYVTATIQPDKVDEFLSHFYAAFEKVAAEPECLSFEVFRVQGEPNKIKWVENWSMSTEWFMQVRCPRLPFSFQSHTPLSLCSGFSNRRMGIEANVAAILLIFSRDDLKHQATKPYMKPYTEATDKLLVGEKQWEVWERFGGKWAKAQEGVYEKV